jgi:hypothetical protein
MIGRSGTLNWMTHSAACTDIWNQDVKRENSRSFFHIPFCEILCHN